tara:strand:+ start:594 stop:770 length:177 start_codon:yes stop_codon:yes gene_type:complete
MTKWNLEDLKLIHRHEYERVCDENRELKERLADLTKELFVVYMTAKKVLGGEDASGKE